MRALPWALAVLVLAWALWTGRGASRAVERAEQAEAVADSLGAVSDSLRAIAEVRDTVLIATTDTILRVVERVRTVQVAVVDSLRQRLDSAEIALLDGLVEAHAEEVAALERLAEERLIWGESWKATAEALLTENAALRLSSQAWEDAARASQKSKWTERVGFGLTLVCLKFCPRPS